MIQGQETVVWEDFCRSVMLHHRAGLVLHIPAYQGPDRNFLVKDVWVELQLRDHPDISSNAVKFRFLGDSKFSIRNYPF